MIFKQLYDLETSTYTYLVADDNTKEGVIIDSVKENLERDLALIKELGIKLVYSLDTHIHADHITATKLMRNPLMRVQFFLFCGNCQCGHFKQIYLPLCSKNINISFIYE